MWNGSSAGFSTSAESPMIRAASECSSMEAKCGASERTSGSTPYLRARMTRLSMRRSARGVVGGQLPDLAERDFGDQQNAADRPVAGDAGAADDLERLAVQLDGGHDADVGEARRQAVGALGRHGEGQIEEAALLAVHHAPNQRDGVEIADDGDARFGRGCQETSLAGGLKSDRKACERATRQLGNSAATRGATRGQTDLSTRGENSSLPSTIRVAWDRFVCPRSGMHPRQAFPEVFLPTLRQGREMQRLAH